MSYNYINFQAMFSYIRSSAVVLFNSPILFKGISSYMCSPVVSSVEDGKFSGTRRKTAYGGIPVNILLIIIG